MLRPHPPVRLLYISVICLFCPSCIQAIVVPSEASEYYPYKLNLIPNFYTLYWKYDAQEITFEVHVFTKGWVGFGLSPDGNMPGADIVIGWVKDGIPFMQDRHGVNQSTPLIDARQDWQLLRGEEESGVTILKFKRPLTLCGPDDLSITDNTVRLIFAHHPDDPDLERPEVLPHHGFGHHRGSRSASLISRSPDTLETPEGTSTTDILNVNVTLTGQKTLYWCQYTTLPALVHKHHVIKFETILQSGNKNTVHHMILYYCGLDYDSAIVGTGFRCRGSSPETGGAPPVGVPCSQVLIAWAKGGESFSFPADIGLAVGGTSKPELVLIETHFDNPRKAAYVDNSGMRLWMMPALRRHEAAVLDIGVVVSEGQILPPDTERFLSLGHCHETCMAQAFEAGGTDSVTVFGYMMHAHVAGVAVRLRQYRNATLLRVVASDDFYDVDFQETRLLKEEIKVEKNDRLVVECVYNTRGRQKATHGGWSTEDEMCLAFLYYYPRIPLYSCLSTPDKLQYAQLLDQNTSFERPMDLRGLAETIKWTPQTIERLQSIVTQGTILSYCGPYPQVKMSMTQPPWEAVKFVNGCQATAGSGRPGGNGRQMAVQVFLLAVVVSAVSRLATRGRGT